MHVDKSNVYIYITVTAVMCVHSTDHHIAAQSHVFSERRMTLSDWPWMCLCLESCHFKLSEERVSGGCYAECCDVARVVVYWKELKMWFWSFCSVTSVWRAGAAFAVVMNQKCRRDCVRVVTYLSRIRRSRSSHHIRTEPSEPIHSWTQDSTCLQRLTESTSHQLQQFTSRLVYCYKS